MAGNPAEQGRPSPDIAAYLQERGGLTPTHWEEVIRRIDNCYGMEKRTDNPYSLSSEERKIFYYGRKVITEQFPDSGNHYKEYLGRRHWEFISGLPTKGRLIVTKKFPFLPHRENNTIAAEAISFAQQESNSSYTLDDHIYYGKLDKWDYRPGGWRRVNDRWEESFYHIEHKSGIHTEYDSGHSFPVDGPYVERIIQYKIYDDQTFYEAWLLKEDEVFTKSLGVSELVYRLRSLATINPDEFRERLKLRTPHLAHLHTSPHFGILEKEIT